MQSNLPPGVTTKTLEDQIDDHDHDENCNCLSEWDLADLANDELNGR